MTLTQIHFAAVLAALTLAGCNLFPSSTTPAGTGGTATTPTTPPPAAGTYLVIRHGHPPINMIVAAGGNVAIVDTTTSKTLATLQLEPNAVLTLTAAKGLTVNSQPTTVIGPISGTDTYEIRLLY